MRSGLFRLVFKYLQGFIEIIFLQEDLDSFLNLHC